MDPLYDNVEDHHYRDEDHYEGAPRRFLILALFSASSFLSAGAWNTLAPIYTIAEERYDVGMAGVNAVALSTFITFVPGCFIALWVVDRYGLRFDFLIGVFTQWLMNLIKWAATASPYLTPHQAYFIMMVGQVLGGLGQPLIFNMVTLVTMSWFPDNERDIATTVAYQSAGVGIIFFSILPPAIVTEPSQLATILLIQFLGFSVVLVLCFFFFAEGPTHPPSAATAMIWAAREEARIKSEKEHVDRNKATFEAMMTDFGGLFQNTNYMLLVTSFAFVQGMAYALPTLVGQFLEPCGYSAVVAGNASAIFALFGIVGNVIVAPIMQKTKQYRIIQQSVTIASAVGVTLLLVVNRPNNLTGVYFAWGLLGLLQGPLGPLTFEHGVEVTYPTSPENAATFLSLVMNVWNTLEIIVLTVLLGLPVSENCESIYTPAAAASMFFLLAGVVTVMLLKDDFRRGNAEKAWAAAKAKGGGMMAGPSGGLGMDEERPLLDGNESVPAYGASPRSQTGVGRPGGGQVRVRGGGVRGVLAACAPGCFSDAESRRMQAGAAGVGTSSYAGPVQQPRQSVGAVGGGGGAGGVVVGGAMPPSVSRRVSGDRTAVRTD